MSDKNKTILLKGNAAIAEGNYEGFIALCSEDTEWTFVGDSVLRGKEAVRQWMKRAYITPPKVTVANLISEGDFLVAIGEVTMKDNNGVETRNAYCDVWQFRRGQIIGLRAFVI